MKKDKLKVNIQFEISFVSGVLKLLKHRLYVNIPSLELLELVISISISFRDGGWDVFRSLIGHL